MIKVLIFEDEPIFAAQVEIILEQIGHKALACFSSTKKAKEFIEKNEIDIILMDIMLGGEPCFPFAIEIADENIPIIFMTQYEDNEMYEQSLQIPHSSFIAKPLHRFTLDRMIKLLLEKHQNTKNSYIRDGRNRIIVKPDDILWIKVDGNYCYIKSKEKQFVFKKSLAQIKRVLPSNLFVQVHRNYLVPIKEVSKINMTDNFLTIHDETIPISRRFKSNIINEIKGLL